MCPASKDNITKYCLKVTLGWYKRNVRDQRHKI